MTDERTTRVQTVLADLGADWAILTSQDAVAYSLQHIASVEAGPSPFDGGPSLAVIGRDGTTGLAVQELEATIASAAGAETVVTYESLGFTDPRPLAEKYAAAVESLLSRLGVGGTVAVQSSVPAIVARLLDGRDVRTIEIDRALARTRAIKTAAEIAALRRCAEVTAAGHAVVRGGSFAGVTELALFHDVRAAMENAAGQRCAVTGDLVSGRERTAAVGGWPSERTMSAGDPVIADLAPRVDGYWGDSCITVCLGEPTAAIETLYAVVYRAWESVLDTLGPGISAHEFDTRIRTIVTSAGYGNPVHIGHSIGTAVHEWPRIIPDEQATLQPGMVVLVEPGGYRPDVGGVRLEKMFLITDSGHEVLSPFEIPRAIPVVAAD